jgi:hypothetical protein
VPLSAYARDKFIAPEMSEFTAASIKDMSEVGAMQGFWMTNFLLNTIYRTEMDALPRQVLFNFLRRVESAFREYSFARERTLAYLDNNEAIVAYLAAIGHWESFLSFSYQAYMLFAQAAFGG